MPLRKAGVDWKGLCPFHSEKTPSFQVDPEQGFFHCFGCKAGGDVFNFLELHEKIGFAEAVRMLAHKFGVPCRRRATETRHATPGSAKRCSRCTRSPAPIFASSWRG